MDAATATLIGVAITGILALFGTIVNNRHQLRQLKAQWEHEDKRVQENSEAARKQQTRKRLQEIYTNAVSTLSEITVFTRGNTITRDMIPRIGEAQKWLSMIVIDYYDDKEGADFDSFYKAFVTFSEQDGYRNAENLRRRVIEFAKNDPRLN